MTLEALKEAIKELPADEKTRLAEWFLHQDAEAWDRQIEEDAASGRLDALADEALKDLREGRCTDR